MDAAEFLPLARRLPEPLLLVDSEGTVLAANRAAAGALGLADGNGFADGGDGSDGSERILLESCVDEPPEKLLEFLRQCSRSGDFLPGRLVCSNAAGGRTFRCEGMAARTAGEAGPPRVLLRLRSQERAGMRFALLNRKIDDLARENSRRRRAEAEREQLLERERRARQEAEEANRLKDEFLATVSHELRTPLNVITGWVDLLAQPEIDEARRQRGVDTIARNARALARLVDDLLDVSRIVTGGLRLDVRPVDLAPILAAAADAVAPAAEAREVELEVVAAEAVGAISADPARLQQVLWNLLTNAVKFTPKGGVVRVELARVGSHAEVAISDTGIGIEPEFLPHVFEPFRQRDASITRVHQGLGLGLAIVRRLVEAHGGTVTAESAGAGRGATFRVQLPLRALSGPDVLETPAEADSEPPAAYQPAADRIERLDGLHLLVVEDDPDARELLFSLFESRGARVYAASSAREGRELLAQQPIDVLVSDIQMPGENGYTFLRRLRDSAGRGADVPAVALTAHGRSEDRLEALRAGFQMHVSKPVEPAELIAVVASLVRRGGEEPG